MFFVMKGCLLGSMESLKKVEEEEKKIMKEDIESESDSSLEEETQSTTISKSKVVEQEQHNLSLLLESMDDGVGEYRENIWLVLCL